MIFINEWLPNPVGADTAGEFVEIFNSEKEAVDVRGWRLEVKSGRKFVLSGEIKSGGFLVAKKPELKLSLNNTDGELFLYDASGKLVDHEQFLSLAPEGKSYSRTSGGTRQNFDSPSQVSSEILEGKQNLGGQAFLWAEPTPGAVNKFLEQTGMINNVYPTGVPLNKSLGVFDFVLLLLGVAAVLTGLIIFVLKKNENLSKLFFRGDEVTWS